MLESGRLDSLVVVLVAWMELQPYMLMRKYDNGKTEKLSYVVVVQLVTHLLLVGEYLVGSVHDTLYC